jgi:5-methyltetrahydrofolate--homocysteine methyltransferase
MDELAARKKVRRVGSAALAGILNRPPSATPVDAPTEPARPAKAASCRPVHAPAHGRRSELPPAPNVPEPPFWGTRIVTDVPLPDVFRFLNERTLMSTQWGYTKNRVDPKEYDRIMQQVALPALERLKRLCIEEKILRPQVVHGYFPCAAEGDDLVVYHDDRRTERVRFRFPRQDHGEFLCLADYFRPGQGTAIDVVAFMAVTVGPEVSRRAREFFESDRYTDYLYLHGLGVETAEALAEYFHKRLRQEWGIGGDDAPQVQKLFKKHYRGCRYSFGYPACPNLEDQVQLFQLLQPERIGLALSEQFQLEPEQSTTALVVHHPQAKYFNLTR